MKKQTMLVLFVIFDDAAVCARSHPVAVFGARDPAVGQVGGAAFDSEPRRPK